MMIRLMRRLRKDENGATAIEYGLIAALVAVAAITAMNSLGTSLGNIFENTANELDNAKGGGGGTP